MDAIREEKFWILTHPQPKARVRARMQSILDESNPSFDLVVALEETQG